MADDDSPTDRIPKLNNALAEWTARAAGESEMLIERLEGMGYEVRGKSEEEIAEILKQPPTRNRT